MAAGDATLAGVVDVEATLLEGRASDAHRPPGALPGLDGRVTAGRNPPRRSPNFPRL